jgi:multidrug transporter EmrE-like cation transporter
MLILMSVTISALAQVALKLGLSSHGAEGAEAAGLMGAIVTPGVLIGLALYGGGTLLWLTALGRVELSQAYPFVGVGFVFTTLAGWLLFGDYISLYRLAGIALIIGGIVLVARS